jgi:hypothetical protein
VGEEEREEKGSYGSGRRRGRSRAAAVMALRGQEGGEGLGSGRIES